MLFNLYLNDFLIRSRKVKGLVVAYADDSAAAAESEEELRDFIRLCKDFFDKRRLRLNTDKSEVLFFGSGKSPKEFEGIPFKKQAQYLGVPYNQQLSISFTLNSFQPKTQLAKI